MTDGSRQYEEMEHAVHVFRLVQTVESGAGDVAYSLSDDPDHGSSAHTSQQGLEGHKNRESHADETERLHITVFLQMDEADGGAGNGAEPHKAEQCPSPITLVAHGNERDGRIATRNMPVDGRMIETAQNLLGFESSWQGMIDGGGDIRAEHTEEVEDDSCACPAVTSPEAPYKEDDANNHTKQDSRPV